MVEIVYLNGKLLPRAEAKISISDWGFLYGYGLYETMRAYNGKIFLLERHIKRLLAGAGAIGLGGLSESAVRRACLDTLAANNLKEARVRLTVTGGEGDAYPWEKSGGKPTLVITARLYRPFPPEKYEKGFRVGIASVRRCRQSAVSGIKSTNYLVSTLARREAAALGLDEALLLNEDGYIAEGGSCNVFFVSDEGLLTPSLESGILPGVTREVVLELAGQLGIKTFEWSITPGDLITFTEAFMTSSIIEIMPLVAMRNPGGQTIAIGKGQPGKVTKKLMTAYKERVKRETQISNLKTQRQR